MDEQTARKMLAETPEYIPGPCPWCGAITFGEAEKRCRPTQWPDGDYYCGTPEEGPNLDHENNPDDPLYQRNPAYDRLQGYLWEWHAVHQGLTSIPPDWPNDKIGGAE